MPFAKSASCELYYESHGEGPALVFAHGAGGNAASWWQQVPFFVDRGHRVIHFDHRGFARSRCAADEMKVEHFPGDLLAILDACGVERAALVCQSMGGWTGLPTAHAHPDRVRALVLCGTPGGVWTDAVREGLATVGERIQRQGLVGPGGAALGASFAKREPALALLYDQISAFNQLPETSTLLAQIATVRVDADALAGFDTPTLVISGHEDVLFPPEVMRSVAETIPGARLSSFEHAGHSTYFEEPERFNRVVAEFLDAHA